MLKNKFICIFLFAILQQPTLLFAQDVTKTSTIGKFTFLKKNELALFDGVLLDPTAIAVVLEDKENSSERFNLKLNYELEKQKIEFNLKQNNLKIENDSKDKQINVLNKQLEETREKLLNKSDNTIWWIGGSFLAGILVASGIVWLVNK